MSHKQLDDSGQRQFIDVRIKELVEYSHNFSRKYLEEREECGRKGEELSGIMEEIRENIKIFNGVLKVRPEVRGEVAGFQGMTSEEIMERKVELESLLKRYQQFEITKKEGCDPLRSDAIIKQSERQLKEAEGEAQKLTETSNGNIRLGLLCLQAICFFFAVISILSSAYSHFLK